MEGIGQVVVLLSDRPCGRCREVIPAGSQALEVPARTSSPDQWGHPRWIVVIVRYHLECWKNAGKG